MIPVLWHHADSFWDCAMPRYILDYATECDHQILKPEGYNPIGRIGVIVIPGRHSCGDYEVLNRVASLYSKVVWIIIGDEEGIFHSDQLQHPNQRLWWFMPPINPKQKVDVPAINGWTTKALDLIYEQKKRHLPRKWDWSFYGQVTHSRRVQCVDALQSIPNGDIVVTPGFSQGVPQEQYFETMVQSKFVPCPAGPCTVDSFRFAEALEAGCIPIADNRTQHESYPPGYWEYVLGNKFFPFWVINDWAKLPDVIETLLPKWKDVSEECMHFWKSYKKSLVRQMRKDLECEI